MMIQVISILLVLSVALPVGAYAIMRRRNLTVKTGKRILKTNIVAFFGLMITATVVLFSGNSALAASGAAGSDMASGLGYIAAALVTGFSTIGAGVAVASSASSALGALSEDPKIMGKALIFVALAEGIALYGVLVSFMILSKIG